MSEMTTTTWVVGAVLGGIMGVLGFLVRNAFSDVKDMLKELTLDVKSLKDVQANDRMENRLLGQRVTQLEREMATLNERLRDLSEGIAR